MTRGERRRRKGKARVADQRRPPDGSPQALGLKPQGRARGRERFRNARAGEPTPQRDEPVAGRNRLQAAWPANAEGAKNLTRGARLRLSGPAQPPVSASWRRAGQLWRGRFDRTGRGGPDAEAHADRCAAAAQDDRPIGKGLAVETATGSGGAKPIWLPPPPATALRRVPPSAGASTATITARGRPA